MQFCVRGCTLRGVHYATCPAYSTGEGCDGCAQAEARNGVLLCNRCYGRLWKQLERVPDLVAHLRSLANPAKATVYDRVMVAGSAGEVAPAPVSSDLLDAQMDIMHTLGSVALPVSADSERAYRWTLGAVGEVLRHFDEIAADKDAALQWWDLVMVVDHPEHPDYWTVAKALRRWPLEERSRWAKQPCPDCGLKTVRISPPRQPEMPTWFACEACEWHRTDRDDDGLWAAMFGLHAETGTKELEMTDRQVAGFKPEPIDMTEPLKAGMRYTLEHAAEVERAGSAGVPAAVLVGAMPTIAEAFARLAEQLAAHVRGTYDNGDLIAGGARLVADVIREVVQDEEQERTEKE